MQTNYQNMAVRQKIRAAFLDPRGPINRVAKNRVVGSVYIITDKRNGKVYVGQTIDFPRRVTEYIRFGDPNSADYTIDRGPIYRTIREAGGVEHFKIRRYYDCTSFDELAEKELYYIDYFLSANPNFGYNIKLDNSDAPTKLKKRERGELKVNRKLGITASALSKKKRSYMCLCVNPAEQIVFLADSMKLFANEILETTRDIVSHAKNNRSRIYGYYIYALDGGGELANVGDNKRRMTERISPLRNEYMQIHSYIEHFTLRNFLEDGFNVFYIRYIENEPKYEILQGFLSENDELEYGDIEAFHVDYITHDEYDDQNYTDDGDQINVFRIIGLDMAKRFAKNLDPRYNLFVSRMNGRVNPDTFPFKDEASAFWAFNNV